MNTDTRRKVFYVVMGADDYLDAFEKLNRLRLPAKQVRDSASLVATVSVHSK
jgi:nucleolar MIF4G domain-containing protein 1